MAEAAGVDALTKRRLLGRVAAAQVSGRVPSLLGAVVRDGELAWSGGYGDVPVGHTDVQYRIGSITKTFTAVLVLQLVRDGRLSLDDRAGSVLGDVGYGDRTVRSLLAHDSGMQSEPAGAWWERSAGLSFEELAAANDGAGEAFPALRRFHYSNLGYALLGEMVARLLDCSWQDAVESRILAPLGMRRTSYLPTPPAAEGWSVHPYTGALVPEPATDTGAMAPAGQLWSTLTDLATYAVFLLDGHRDVLDAADLAPAYVPQSGDPGGLDQGRGLGFQLVRGGSGMLVGHTGSMPGFLAACLVDRERRTAALCLADATVGFAPGALATELLEELEASEPTLPVAWAPSAPLPDLLEGVPGTWFWGNTPLVFGWEGTELVSRRAGVVRDRFVVTDARVRGVAGYHAGEELKIVRRADGTVGHLDIATFIHTRTPYDPEAPIPGGPPGR